MSTNMRKIAVALTMGTAVLAATSAAQAQEPFRMIVTEPEVPLVQNSVMFLAQELGYYEDNGVTVEFVRVTDTTLASAALQAGEGEMANIALDATMQMVANDVLDLRAVTSPNKFLPFLIACVDDVETVDDIAGRDFAVNRVGSLDYGLSRMVMTEAGLDVETVNYVPIGFTSARAEALAAGQVECATMSIGVWLSIPDRSGLRIVVPVAEYGDAAPVVNKVNVVRAETLEERYDDVVAVIRALTELSRHYNENPDAWVQDMLQVRPDQDEETLTALAETFVGTWSVNGGISADELTFSVGEVFKSEEFAGLEEPDLDEWVDFGPVDDVLAEIGVDESADAPTR